MAQELGNLEQSRFDTYNSMQAQEQMVPRAYNKKVKQKIFAEGDLVRRTVLPIGTKNPRIGAFSPNGKGRFRRGAFQLRDEDGERHDLGDGREWSINWHKAREI
ncbi:unnamed protein product [Prunus armeniaca]